MVSWIRPTLLVILILIVQACTKDQPTPVDTVNKIKILNVTPMSGLTDGQQVNFVVDVNYNLYSLKTGTLLIGFNNGQSSSGFVMQTNANKVISKGSGTYTFNVSTAIKNWSPQADFYVYVNLSEDPLPTTPGQSWTPLANDQFVLIPK